ncbi:MAG: hypothetical protein COB66_07205 [Coxiella sp. (in: Bacteria)]|nr:MAG: hypothetical protein COB66_07205 [Coxiella sp. (in: g-proteobacteria)]
MFFSPSVRTHLSFSAATTELGGHAQYMEPAMARVKSKQLIVVTAHSDLENYAIHRNIIDDISIKPLAVEKIKNIKKRYVQYDQSIQSKQKQGLT